MFRKFEFVDESTTNEELQWLCGVLDVNTFELRSPGGLQSEDAPLLRGLFLEAAMMAHACRGNTHLTVDDDFRMAVYASVPIKKGDPIFFNYTSSLLVTSIIFKYFSHISIITKWCHFLEFYRETGSPYGRKIL